MCTQWTPAGPVYLGSPPSQHQQRPEEEERQETESGPGQWPISGQYSAPGTNQRPAGEVREASSGPGCAGVATLVLATASGARKQPQVSPIGCPSTARRGDQPPPHNHTASWTQSFSSPWQQPSLSSALSRQVSPVYLSSCHGVFWLRGTETLSHNQVWLSAEDCGHTSECEGGHYHMSLPWHQTMNN